MTSRIEPVAGESLAEAGERIRDAAPIRGERATDEDCRIRRELIDETLADRGVEPGDRSWHTAQLIDGHVVGVWARSADEAELDLTVWGASAATGSPPTRDAACSTSTSRRASAPLPRPTVGSRSRRRAASAIDSRLPTRCSTTFGGRSQPTPRWRGDDRDRRRDRAVRA